MCFDQGLVLLGSMCGVCVAECWCFSIRGHLCRSDFSVLLKHLTKKPGFFFLSSCCSVAVCIEVTLFKSFKVGHAVRMALHLSVHGRQGGRDHDQTYCVFWLLGKDPGP